MAGRIAYLGNIATQGLVLNLDAAIKGSYPGTGTTWTDVSNNGNNGTIISSSFTASDYGAISFSGTSSYVVISSSAAIAAGTNDFCADFWLSPTNNLSTYAPVFVAATTNGIWIGRNQTNFVLRAYAVADRIQNPILPATSSWTNVTITRNGTNNVMYYNGAPSATSSSNQNYVQSATYLGSDGPSGSSTTYFTGKVATTKYYNQALTQFQVWQNFNSYKSRYGIPDIVTDGLVLNLDAGNPYSYLSGSSGTTWSNVAPVSSSLSGSLLNGARYSNGAMVFDGVDDYVSCGNVLFNNVSAVTISMWVNIQTFTNNNTIISKGAQGEGSNTTFAAWIISSSGIINRFFNSTGTESFVNTGTLSQNTWYNLTWTYNGSAITVYTNSIVGETAALSGPLKTNTNPLNIASSIYGNNTQMICSGTQIYNRALSQAEITQNFNALRGRYGI
jgi:hypothetical protein